MTDRPQTNQFEDRWVVTRWKRRRQYHILPIDDTREHVAPGLNCWCNPKIVRYENGARLITHDAEDGRQLVERHGVN